MAENKEKTALRDVIAVTYITNDNGKFELVGEFIKLTLTAKNDEGKEETKT